MTTPRYIHIGRWLTCNIASQATGLVVAWNGYMASWREPAPRMGAESRRIIHRNFLQIGLHLPTVQPSLLKCNIHIPAKQMYIFEACNTLAGYLHWRELGANSSGVYGVS